MPHTVVVNVFTPTGAPLAAIAALTSLDVTQVCDGGVDATRLVIPTAHADAQYLGQDGNRVRVVVDNIEVTTGVITQVEIDTVDAEITATVTGDWDVLNNVLASPIPEATDIHASFGTRESLNVNGPAETVALGIINQQVNRAGYTLTVPASSGAGPFVACHQRWETVMEDVTEFLKAVPGTWRIRHTGGVGTTPATCPLELTKTAPRSAGLVRWDSPEVARMTITRKRPDVTRLVTAADGQGTTREVYGWLTATSVAATWPNPELRYGPREKFVEARNAASFLDHQTVARDELAKGRGGTTIDLDLAETPTRQWGRDWLLGDTITVALPDGTTVNDRITQVQIVANATDGVRITPKVGDTNATTNPDLARELALTGVIRELSRTQRR